MEEGSIIIQEWGLDGSGLHTKDAILAALGARIDSMLATDPMGFIQTMYRLDIPELQLNDALDHPQAASLIAQLIWDRQIRKSMYRRSHPPPDRGNEEDLAW